MQNGNSQTYISGEIISKETSQKHTRRVCINHICLLQDNDELVGLLEGMCLEKKQGSRAAGSSRGGRLMHLGKLPPPPHSRTCMLQTFHLKGIVLNVQSDVVW